MTRIVSFELEHYSQSKIKPTSAAKFMPIMSEKVIKISGDLLIIAKDFKTLTSILLKSSDFFPETSFPGFSDSALFWVFCLSSIW